MPPAPRRHLPPRRPPPLPRHPPPPPRFARAAQRSLPPPTHSSWRKVRRIVTEWFRWPADARVGFCAELSSGFVLHESVLDRVVRQLGVRAQAHLGEYARAI